MKKELAIEFALVKISTEEFATFEENFAAVFGLA